MPCTIKDSFAIAGVRTTAGAQQWAGYVPEHDAVAVARLRQAGAVLLGHTNVPTMLADWQSFNPIFGVTSNPWDLARTPGGSSGGCAAALAAGLTYLSLGSDIGGSLRVPAHFCGIFAHKPTLNVVPLRGQIPPAPGTMGPPPTLPVAGPLARSATDLLIALQVLGGPVEDARAYRWTLPPARAARLADYRIGYVVDDPRCPLASDVGDVLARAVDALRKAGATLREGWPDGVNPEQQDRTYRSLLLAALGFENPTLQQHRAAERERVAARAAWQAHFRAQDVFLLPTAFVAAFPHDHRGAMTSRTLTTPAGPRPYLDLLFWISFATLTGLPATVVPVGLTRDGLPVGLQVVGPYLEDATPIDVAGRIADVVGGFRRPPAY